MTERMYRAQILLDPRQRRKLEEIAQREGKSISAITRQAIDAGLKQMESDAEVWKKRTQVLSLLRTKRGRQAQEYSGDLIDQVRQEREDERDDLWGNRA